MRSLRLRVLTPTRTVFDQPVDAVIAPLADGWIGVLPGHTPFQARVMAGQIALRGQGEHHTIATHGGLLSIEGDVMSIVAGVAELDADVSTLEQRVGEAAKRARLMEQEAEKHFGRVYRALADTLEPQRQRRP